MLPSSEQAWEPMSSSSVYCYTEDVRRTDCKGVVMRSMAMAFSVWTQFTVQTGVRSELPRGMPLVTRVFASSEHALDPMASSSVNFCRKTHTVHCRREIEVLIDLGPRRIWFLQCCGMKHGGGR
jgi:hypothetical protein